MLNSACAIKDCYVPTHSLRHNGADVKFRPQFAFAFANANSDFTPSYRMQKKTFLKERFGIFFNNSSCVEG